MPFTVDDTPFGSLSVTLADVDSTLAASIMATAPATLSLNVGTPGPGVPAGGTTGQVLKKVSGTDYDTAWQTDLNTGVWGSITGTLSNQTDLQTALNLKADLASPALTGVPTAPTAATLTSTTQLATTAFVQQELAAGTAVAKNLEVYVRNQTGATLTAGTIVYINGATGNRPTVTKAQANNDANSAQTFGFTKTSIANNGFGYVIVRGELENVDTSALTEGQQLYLSPTTAGTWTTTKPSAPNHLVYVGIVVRAHPTQGVILVAIQNGYELTELHDVKITSASNGQVLKYDSAQGLWVNGTVSAGVAWGGITGTLSNQTDLQTALDAKATAADYLSKSGNLSGLADTSVARTNLGLGTMATETASNYLTTATASSTYAPLASPALTGTPTAPTAAAATNTTQIATTAFVQQEVPAASTTASGKVELATEAEAQKGSSSTLAITPLALSNAKYSQSYYRLSGQAWAFSTSGTGAGAALNNGTVRVIAPTSLTGYAIASQALVAHRRIASGGTGHSQPFDWSKRFVGRFRMGPRTAASDSNSVWRVNWGKASSTTTGDLANAGIGIKRAAAGSVILQVHNGSTLTSVTSSLSSLPVNSWFDFVVISDGAGNVTLYSDDSSIATTSAGPTAAANPGTNMNFVTIEAENLASITGGAVSVWISEVTSEFSIT